MPYVFVWTGRLSGGVLGFSGRIHNPVDGSCVSYHNILLLYKVKNVSLLYDISQQVSHKILMDTKEVWHRIGTGCTCVFTLGRHGRSRFSVCVDCSVLLSGIFMTRILVAGLIFLSGAPGRIKCPVAPASAMDFLLSILFWVR